MADQRACVLWLHKTLQAVYFVGVEGLGDFHGGEIMCCSNFSQILAAFLIDGRWPSFATGALFVALPHRLSGLLLFG